MKESEWISAKINPILKGWYKCRSKCDGFAEGMYAWRYWSGDKWKWVGPDSTIPFDPARHPSIKPTASAGVSIDDHWCGLIDE